MGSQGIFWASDIALESEIAPSGADSHMMPRVDCAHSFGAKHAPRGLHGCLDSIRAKQRNRIGPPRFGRLVMTRGRRKRPPT